VVLPSPGGAKAEPVSERKVVGVLVTYSTRPDGQIFAVREGRNRIGRNLENEIAVPDDIAMSGLNSFIIFHLQGKKQFMIDDANSQNGTFVNGEIIEDRSRLPNYSEIKAGSTVFKFIVVEPAGNSSTTVPEDSQKGGVDGADMSEL
jgi:pSer/pThr/pTyr-binding forkhead associated (FHA) protein